MKKFSLLFIAGLFIGSLLFLTSCKKSSNDPSEAEIIQNNIKATLDSIIDNTHVPGLVAGVWAPNENIDFVYTAGVADLETKSPLSDGMVFRIGSNTKTFTITVLLQLVDEGLISLEDKLSDYLPDYPRANEVTIRMMTNMTSGIFKYMESEEFWTILEANPAYVWSFDELINCTVNHDYYFDPGTGFYYSNTNTILLAKIIEQLTGKSIKENITNRIITPLNLTSTEYLVSGIDIPGNHSKAYYMGEYDPEFPECSSLMDISMAGPAGSITSTIYELKKYAIAMTEGDFLSDSLNTLRLGSAENGHSNPMGLKYGIGLFAYKGFFGHNGGFPGYTSLMVHSPEKNCTIIIWYNCQLPETPTDLLYVIPNIIYKDL